MGYQGYLLLSRFFLVMGFIWCVLACLMYRFYHVKDILEQRSSSIRKRKINAIRSAYGYQGKKERKNKKHRFRILAAGLVLILGSSPLLTAKVVYGAMEEADEPNSSNAAPVIQVSYSEEGELFSAPVTVSIQIIDDDFDPQGIQWTMERTDRNHQILPASLDQLTDRENWTLDEGEETIWSTQVLLAGDGIYRWSLSAVDLEGNCSDRYESPVFVIDQGGPDASSLVISASEPLHIWKQIEGGIPLTFLAYNNEVKISVQVSDVISGIDHLEWVYQALEDGQAGTVTYQSGMLTEEDLYPDENGVSVTGTIALTGGSQAQYRGMLTLTAVDKAGNKTVWENIGNRVYLVDTHAPEVTYILPAPVIENETVAYYDQPMELTIQVAELNFYNKDPILTINGTIVNGVNWYWDPTDCAYVTKIPLQVDGAYQVALSYTDRSGNLSDTSCDVNIVVDKTQPICSVACEEPVFKQDDISYYQDAMEGTIQVTDDNFDPAGIVVLAVPAGQERGEAEQEDSYVLPVAWKSQEGNTHIGAFSHEMEGEWKLCVQCTDQAGNTSPQWESAAFFVDRTAPVIHVSPILNDSAHGDPTCQCVVTVLDERAGLNPDQMQVELYGLVQQGENTYDRIAMELSEMTFSADGHSAVVKSGNLEQDGLYELTVSATDQVGNQTVQIETDDGTIHDHLLFSVNRNGSVYMLEPYTESLLENYYVGEVTEDLVIHEINVDPVSDYKVTVNDNVLLEGTDYSTEEKHSADTWNERIYRIHSDCFSAEGSYSIVLSSTDKTGAVAYNDIKSQAVHFVVDQSPPAVAVMGLKEHGTYREKEHDIILLPTDDGGKLQRLQVLLQDQDGKALTDQQGADISVLLDMDEEKLDDMLQNQEGAIHLTLPVMEEGKVVIRCMDRAVYADGTTNELLRTYEHITVKGGNNIEIQTDEVKEKDTHIPWIIIGVLAFAAGVLSALVRKKLQNKK